MGWQELNSRVAQFQQSMPSIDRIHPARQDLYSKILLISLLVHCTTIELHQPLEARGTGIVPNSRSLTAALAAVDVLSRINIGGITHVDPIVGFLLVSVARVLVRALISLRQDASAVGSNEENQLLVALAHIRFALETWGERNAYIRSQQTALANAVQGT